MANDALLQAALTAARAGDLEEAASLFARLVKEEPSSEQGWLGLGFCFSDNKRREYCFLRVLAINPNNPQAHVNRGNTYKALGDRMREEIHALSMQTLTPGQWAERGRG